MGPNKQAFGQKSTYSMKIIVFVNTMSDSSLKIGHDFRKLNKKFPKFNVLPCHYSLIEKTKYERNRWFLTSQILALFTDFIKVVILAKSR